MIILTFLKHRVFVRAGAACLLVLSACVSVSHTATSTTSSQPQQVLTNAAIPRPKLIVGIVVDQMRYDYLYRYWDKYSNYGFKKLVTQGFNFKNNHYSYVPTYTGPGHASVYTGSTPALNGIIGNDWYVRSTGKTIYCAEDKSVQTVGSTSDAGQMSPANMLTTTITDELRLATNMGSKVIGVALKDRGSILPAGHLANAAYWFDSPSGNWITSTFYTAELPEWANAFNNEKLADKYLNEPWNTLLPIEQYTESTKDDVYWEGVFSGEQKPVFPHNVPALRGKDYELLRSVPAGNTFTKDFALAAMQAENMGKGNFTDFLAVSFSTPDYVGHRFGPNSIEIQDIYLRLDKEIAELISVAEKQAGKGNVLFFLTADHGAAHVPAFMKEHKIPAGVASSATVRDSVGAYLSKVYGPGKWVERYINQQLYLNRSLIESKKLNLAEVQQHAATYVLRFPAIAKAVTATALQQSSWSEGLMRRIENGYNAQRSGDVMIVLQPAWFEGGAGPTGTTHGSHSNHDTHVPLVWYGWGVQAGESSVLTEITDIAPTIASWLYIQEPNGSVGKPLQPYMK